MPLLRLAPGGERARRHRHDQPPAPDLVLVDLHLPDGSGLEVAEWMRTMPLLTRVRVVVVSADSTQSQRDAATVADARDYLAKPIRLAETLQLIDELLPAET